MFSSNTTQTSGGYQISRSLRFNSADSAYLNRTPASASNRKTWTWSGWIKRSNITSRQLLIEAYLNATDTGYFGMEFTSDAVSPRVAIGGGVTTWRITNQVFRDVSAWYHIVLAVDTTQATANNRIRLYVNGSEVTSFSTVANPAQNDDTGVNSTGPFAMGAATNGNACLSGYMTEVNFIDGQALTPSSFGEYNADTGVWQPKAYSGSYGTNGFYVNFSDNSNTTAATLGKDYSGNGNNWTPNNFSVAAGAGNDSLVDVPTNWGTDTGAGGSVRGNYCTLNPLDQGSSITISNGNLDITTSTGWRSARSTFGMTSGKWYWEVAVTSGSQTLIGIATSSATLGSYVGSDVYGWSYYSANGNKFNNNNQVAYGSTYTAGDIIGVAFDADAGTLVFYKNNTSQGTAYTGLTSGPYFPSIGVDTSVAATFNFGQRPFAYTAPSGYKALCTQNLPTPTIGATTATQAGKFFNALTYTGNGGTLAVTGNGFKPDFSWIKSRSGAQYHILQDVLRGNGSSLFSNDTSAQVGNSGDLITSWDTDGLTVNVNFNGTVGNVSTNGSGSTYVAWNWKANGAGSTNTAGSITSTVSANTTSGFSVVSFSTPTGVSAYTVGHGLGVAPSLIIIKNRTFANNWAVYHASLGNTQYINLNLTNAATTDSTYWNNTSPSSTVFTLGTAFVAGSSFPQIAYCFAEVPGFSKFGSYVGNGSSDGVFVYTGFRPAYVIVKSTQTAEGWWIFDNKRNPYNVSNSIVAANSSGAEITGDYGIDLTANGFKIRNSQGFDNSSGTTYIFAAFAESPFKYALAR